MFPGALSVKLSTIIMMIVPNLQNAAQSQRKKESQHTIAHLSAAVGTAAVTLRIPSCRCSGRAVLSTAIVLVNHAYRWGVFRPTRFTRSAQTRKAGGGQTETGIPHDPHHNRPETRRISPI